MRRSSRGVRAILKKPVICSFVKTVPAHLLFYLKMVSLKKTFSNAEARARFGVEEELCQTSPKSGVCSSLCSSFTIAHIGARWEA